MNTIKMQAKDILSRLSNEEKARLCSGADFWHTKSATGADPIMMSDGPHGLRAQMGDSDHLGINGSEPSTCFPPACATASSFDRALLQEMGAAIGEEANALNISVVLGPGANLKRNPLCGRNFEYFSEDPYLSGEMASAWIEGVQSQGVGACLKHFAANNQERARFINNSVVDERALRELYLSAFERAVKQAKPWCVMSSYNQLNGGMANESHRLMTEILREEWGFDGLVMTDWGAIDDRVAALHAGVDLEMPYVGKEHDEEILAAVDAGTLRQEELDTAALRVLELMLRGKKNAAAGSTDHHELARKIARESAVLLKNDDHILPLPKGAKVAVLGSFAKTPRYQGAGSSRINPIELDSPLEKLQMAGYDTVYADESDPAAAAAAAKQADYAVVFAGLPDAWESEGYDRDTMAMPESHVKLIEATASANPNTVVVLLCGSPVELKWRDQVKGILLMYLGGEAVGSACADLLSGLFSPMGKLAETWAEKEEDVSSHLYFAKDAANSEYRESIFVGYRWFDTAKRTCAYPFGYGLSYTDFRVSDASASTAVLKKGDNITVSATVENSGKCNGAEVLQLYVKKIGSAIMRAEKELKGFEKVHLAPGEKKTVSMELDERAFSYYDTAAKAWQVEQGEYELLLGTSSQEILFRSPLTVEGEKLEPAAVPLSYQKLPAEGVWEVSFEDFRTLFDGEVPLLHRSPLPFTHNTLVGELDATAFGSLILRIMRKVAGGGIAGQEGDDADKMLQMGLMEYPLRVTSMSRILSVTQVEGLVDVLNGKVFRGIRRLIPKK